MRYRTGTGIILTTHLCCLQSPCLYLLKQCDNTPVLFPFILRLRSGGVKICFVSSEDHVLLLDCFSTSNLICSTATSVLVVSFSIYL